MRRLLLLALLVCGCEKADTARHQDNIPLDKVPTAAMSSALKTAKERFPDLKFESAWKKPNGDFEITGKTKSGKIHDIEVTESGEVTEVE